MSRSWHCKGICLVDLFGVSQLLLLIIYTSNQTPRHLQPHCLPRDAPRESVNNHTHTDV